MNLILLTPHDFISDDCVRLDGRRHAHICTVLKARPGQILQVGMVDGLLGNGEISAITRENVELRVTLDQAPPPPPPITLLLALPRPKVLKRVLEGVTAFGIKQVYLLNTWRVDKSYWQSPLLHGEALHTNLLLGLEQARDTVLPEIRLRRRFKPFVEDELPDIVLKHRQAFLADPAKSLPCPGNVAGPTLLAIGPEGGFIPYEVDKFLDCAFRKVYLGQRALRVETAVPALLGRLLHVP